MMESMVDTGMLGSVFYVGAVALVLLGLYCAVTMRHLIRVLLGLMLLQAGVNLFFVAMGFRPDAGAPILNTGALPAMVDPIPQALILTAIVIGIGILALALALAVRVHAAYGTLDTQEVAQRVAREGLDEAVVAIPHLPSRLRHSEENGDG